MIAFFVAGTPVPQGSKSSFIRNGRVISIDQKNMATKTKPRGRLDAWRNAVATCARIASCGRTFDGPVRIKTDFRIPRPKSHYLKTGKLSAAGKRWPFPYQHNSGDGDKYTRAVWDGLSAAGVWGDDCQPVNWTGSKRWAANDNVGVYVEIEEVDPWDP